jgi:hypothetical protein
MSKATPKNQRKSRATGFPLSGHDEPFVVDNGPVSVLFGTKHKVESLDGGKTWIRHEAQNFFLLFIQEQDDKGKITHFAAWKLKMITLVRVTLKDGDTLEFSMVQGSGTQNLQMVGAAHPLKREKDTGRLTFKNNKKVVITQVEGLVGTSSVFTYKPETNPKHIKALFLLEPA